MNKKCMFTAKLMHERDAESRYFECEQPSRGGKRKGAGRKSNFSEKTVSVKFTCPESKAEELKIFVKTKLAEWHTK